MSSSSRIPPFFKRTLSNLILEFCDELSNPLHLLFVERGEEEAFPIRTQSIERIFVLI